MAIKFGDLIQNINADQAIIDLIQNHGKGIQYISTDTASEIIAIPEEKRGIGTVVIVQDTGLVYVFTGSVLLEQSPGAISSGAWEDWDSTTSNWEQVGKVPIRETDLYANIKAAPELLDDDATLADVRAKVNELIQNPPESFGQFTAGELVVGAGENLNALDIIVKALSATQAYDLTIDSIGGVIEFGQQTGSLSLNGSVSAVNFNLLNANGANTIPVSYKWYYREIGQTDWEEVNSGFNTIDTSNINSATSTVELDDTHDYTADDQSSQFGFAGFEYQLELRDNSTGATANVTNSQSPFLEATPVVAIATGATITPGSYAAPAATVSIGQLVADQETTANYDADALRTKGNLASQVLVSFSPGSANAGPLAVLPITETKLVIEKSINGGNFQASDVAANGFTLAPGGTNPVGTGNYEGTTSALCGFTDAQISTSPETLDAFRFKLFYKDAFKTSFTLAATSPTVKLRFPIFAGFDDAASTSVPGPLGDENTVPADLTAGVIQGLSVQLGSYTSTDSLSNPSYAGVNLTGATFPLLDPFMGFAQEADDSYGDQDNGGQGDYYTPNSPALAPVYGWIHNSATTNLPGNPSPFPATAGVGETDTRFWVATPNTGFAYGIASSLGNQAFPSFLIDLTINGITREYRVSGSMFVANHNSVDDKQLVAIISI